MSIISIADVKDTSLLLRKWDMALSQHQGHKPDLLTFFSHQWRRFNNDGNTYQYLFNIINGRGDTSVDWAIYNCKLRWRHCQELCIWWNIYKVIIEQHFLYTHLRWIYLPALDVIEFHHKVIWTSAEEITWSVIFAFKFCDICVWQKLLLMHCS